MKRIFQQIMMLSVALTMICACWEDPAGDDYIYKIELDKTQASIPVGGAVQLNVTLYPSTAKYTMLKWVSDDESIAVVGADGLVRGVAPGLTIIRVNDIRGKVYPTTCAIAVYAVSVPVTGVSIDKSETTVSVNGSERLNHTVEPSNATNKNVAWSSNDASIVTVDNNGKITGIAAGTATITLTSEDGGLTSSCLVTVTNEAIPVTGLSLNKTAVTVSINGTEQIAATVVPENATNKNVTWSSNATDVATVSAEGVITGIAAGTATVTATSEDGGFASSCVITVQETAIPVTGVSLNKTVLTVSVNGTEQLAATIAPANATNKNVTWNSNAVDVATVSAEGLITGIAAGTATVTVTSEDGGFASSCVVTVQETVIPVTGLSLNTTVLTVLVNGTEQLEATVSPSNATNKNVTWSSNATAVATVDAAGLITGISAGTATVTATSENGGFTASCVITVEEVTVPVTGVSLDTTVLIIPVNGTGQLAATVAPSNATNKNVTWSSNAAAVATVDAGGLITGISAGTATVTATSEDGGFTASCVITVQEAAVPVTGVSLDKTVLAVSVNETGQLVATVSPSNATNKNVTWSSNATGIATVSAEGLVTGVAVGTATITATSEDGGFVSNCEVTVQNAAIPVTGVSLDKTAINIYIGDVEQLSATVVPNDAANTGVTWSSSSTTVVTVSDAGLVTGVSAGTATVTVTSDDGKFTATCTVTVEDEMGNVTSTGWTAPSSNSYEYSMTYVAQVAFRGTLSTNVNTEVAAFVGNELRGHAKLIYEPQLDVYLVNLVIYSKKAGNETVVLKAYNPETQRIYENCKEFTFYGDTSLGSSSEVLNCQP
jgi:uncharacterized protein YjdB